MVSLRHSPLRYCTVLLGRVVLICSLASLPARAQEAGKHVQGPDVIKATLNSTLAGLPEDARVLMEFYATWCPACRAFKPEYDKVARFLQTLPGGQKQITALRLDCAVDPDVCGTYQVSAYPTLYAATAADFLAVNVDQFQKFQYGKYARSAPGVVKFVSDAFKTELTYVEPKQELKPLPDNAKGETKVIAADLQWTNADVQLATTQLFDSITAQELLHNTGSKRQALVDMLTVWAATHPVPACKSGSAEILETLKVIWPDGQDKPGSDLKQLHVCGECSGDSGLCNPNESPAAAAAAPGSSSSKSDLSWAVCKGSKPDQRGFTCALWLLFHTTAARLSDEAGAKLFMKSQRGFAVEFFQCAVCKKHFERITGSPEAKAVKSPRDAVLWVWKAHNEVNERLAMIEKKYGHSSTGDAAYPKVQWPTTFACPQCRLPVLQKKSDERGGSDGGRRTGESQSYGEEPIRWNEEEVYRFLVKWYGGEPGDGKAELADGPPPFLTGESDADEALYGDESGTALGLLSGSNLIVSFMFVAAIATVALLLYGRQRRRRHVYGGVKGPGAVGPKGYGASGSNGTNGKHAVRLDAEAWGGARYPAPLNRKGQFSAANV